SPRRFRERDDRAVRDPDRPRSTRERRPDRQLHERSGRRAAPALPRRPVPALVPSRRPEVTGNGTPSQLFVSGPARSGTTLVARVLSAHTQVEVAPDPALPLFRSLRNAILRESGLLADPGLPLQDYYFSAEGLRALDAIQASSLAVPF